VKLSCLPVSFFQDIQQGRMTVRDWAVIARDVGLDAIDLSTLLVANHTPAYLEALKTDVAEVGVPLAMITTYTDFSHPDAAQREREMEYARCDVALTSELGARYLRILAGQAHPGTGRKTGIKWVVDGFKRLEETAVRLGVQLVFENHSKPSAWRHADFSHPTDIFLEICRRIRDTGIGVNFDTANTLVYGDDPLPVLEEVIGKVMTVHAADTASTGSLSPVLIGTGVAPIRAVFERLKKHGFDGWVCIEEASGLGKIGVQQAVANTQALWHGVTTAKN
jgi:sugar phosphate isomerase/epimerase